MPRDQQQERRADQRLVVRRCRPRAAWRSAGRSGRRSAPVSLALDQLVHVVAQLVRPPLRTSSGWRARDSSLGPGLEEVVVGVGHAEQLADHQRRHGQRERRDQVGRLRARRSIASMCSSTISWIRGRSAASRLTVNSPTTARRAGPCSGGSIEIIDGLIRRVRRWTAARSGSGSSGRPVGGERGIGEHGTDVRVPRDDPHLLPAAQLTGSPAPVSRGRRRRGTGIRGAGKLSVHGVPRSIWKDFVRLFPTVATANALRPLSDGWDNPANDHFGLPLRATHGATGTRSWRVARRSSRNGASPCRWRRSPAGRGRRRHALPAFPRPRGADPRGVQGRLRAVAAETRAAPPTSRRLGRADPDHRPVRRRLSMQRAHPFAADAPCWSADDEINQHAAQRSTRWSGHAPRAGGRLAAPGRRRWGTSRCCSCPAMHQAHGLSGEAAALAPGRVLAIMLDGLRAR